jgi:hypothetical protein
MCLHIICYLTIILSMELRELIAQLSAIVLWSYYTGSWHYCDPFGVINCFDNIVNLINWTSQTNFILLLLLNLVW